jgi:hypothetical protein
LRSEAQHPPARCAKSRAFATSGGAGYRPKALERKQERPAGPIRATQARAEPADHGGCNRLTHLRRGGRGRLAGAARPGGGSWPAQGCGEDEGNLPAAVLGPATCSSGPLGDEPVDLTLRSCRALAEGIGGSAQRQICPGRWRGHRRRSPRPPTSPKAAVRETGRYPTKRSTRGRAGH